MGDQSIYLPALILYSSMGRDPLGKVNFLALTDASGQGMEKHVCDSMLSPWSKSETVQNCHACAGNPAGPALGVTPSAAKWLTGLLTLVSQFESWIYEFCVHTVCGNVVVFQYDFLCELCDFYFWYQVALKPYRVTQICPPHKIFKLKKLISTVDFRLSQVAYEQFLSITICDFLLFSFYLQPYFYISCKFTSV